MNQTLSAAIIVGVDTHKLTHAAVAITGLGARLGDMTIPASAKGYRDLETWAKSLGAVQAFGIEGTGSYGAGLSRFLCEQGHTVLEVGRPNRQFRHQKGAWFKARLHVELGKAGLTFPGQMMAP